MSELTQDKCEKVYSVGHSLGGALATLFAFCANQEQVTTENADKASVANVRGSRREEVMLLTFGAPGVSVTPMHSGSPGICFQGRRIGIGQAPLPEAPQPTEFFEVSA